AFVTEVLKHCSGIP
ncbi:hypothetical protein CapIbe_005422, partial [Capra ibex]